MCLKNWFYIHLQIPGHHQLITDLPDGRLGLSWDTLSPISLLKMYAIKVVVMKKIKNTFSDS